MALLIFLINSLSLFAQITGQLTYMPEEEKYLISVVPNQTLTAPKNITNTGQITLKATAGVFEIASISSINGIWTKAATIKSPIESPDFDYHVFVLGALLSNPPILSDVVLPLFSFKNAKECSGNIELVQNFKDEFWPPNSMNANIGNQLTILGFGINNAYEKNDAVNNKVDCPKILDIELTLDSLKCAADTTTLLLKVLDGDLPFIYTIAFEDGSLLKDSLIQYGIAHSHKIPVGNHIISGFDQLSNFSQSINAKSPSPLEIDVLEHTNITCHVPQGTIKVEGKGGLSEDSFQYKWNNGKNGKVLNQLAAGLYEVTLSDKNNCRITESITVVATSPLSLDSIELYPPTCRNASDGIIEILGVSNGTPPFQFALNDSSFQQVNYFDNLMGGSYQLYVTDSEKCVTTERVTLTTPAEILISYTQKDTYLLKGTQILLAPKIDYKGPLYYNWTPNRFLSCSDCPNPTAKPTETITYRLTARTELGCEASIEKKLKVYEKTPIFVPNIFSPRSNGANTELNVFIGPTIQQIVHFQIFNRWGQLIYNLQKVAPNQNIAWNGYFDGKLVDSGVYIYLIEVLLKNNKTEIHRGDFFLKK